MGIIVLNSGMKTTIQDRGRYGYQSSGFSVSGVMDRRSATLANFLVGNEPGEPVIEFVLTGPEISFTKDTIIALTGGAFRPRVNGNPVENYCAIEIRKDRKLRLSGYSKWFGKRKDNGQLFNKYQGSYRRIQGASFGKWRQHSLCQKQKAR